MMDITTAVNELGEFDPIRIDELPVTGKDGAGQKTPTVRELIEVLKSLPEQFQDLPVTRYVEEGVWGIRYELKYEHEAHQGNWTAHIAMW